MTRGAGYRWFTVGMTAAFWLVLAGCAYQPAQAPDEAPAEKPPADAPAGQASPEPADEGLLVAPGDEAIAARRAQLLERGYEALGPERVGYYRDVLTARFRQALVDQPVEIEHRGVGIALTLPGLTTFETDSAEIHPATGSVLDTLAGILHEYRASVIVVAGHTDSQGAPGYNQHLSERRALSVARRLVSGGVAAERLVVRGYGPDRPIASNETSEGQARNRRVELLIQPLSG